MTEIPTVECNWLEDKQPYTKTRAIRELTAGCPCDRCAERQACGVECARFQSWVRTGR